MLDDFTKVTVSKRDIATGEELPGATLQILPVIDGSPADIPAYEWVSTDEPHYIERIPVGDYILRETLPPIGYVTAEDVPFTVTETEVVQSVVMYDELIPPDGSLDKTGNMLQVVGLIIVLGFAVALAFIFQGKRIMRKAKGEIAEDERPSEAIDSETDEV
jgi:hypothetical protein